MSNLNQYGKYPSITDPNSNSPSKQPLYPQSVPNYGGRGQTSSLLENDLQEIQKMYEIEGQELQKRYQNIFERYTRLGKSFQDTEAALEDERKKYAILTENYNNVLREAENDRKVRQALERDLTAYRDELKRKDLMLAEYEKQTGKLQQQNNQLAAENGQLRTELQRINDTFRAKVKELEDTYGSQLREFKARNDALLQELERNKADFINQIQQLNADWEAKYRALQQQLAEKDAQLQDISGKFGQLAGENDRLRNEFKNQLAREVAAVKNDEEKKWETILDEVKSQWTKALSEERYYWENKTQEIDKELGLRNKQLQDMKGDYDRELGNLHNELQNYQNQFNLLKAENERLRKELAAKDQIINRYDAELQNLRGQLAGLKDLINERKRLEEANRALQQQLMERDRILAQQEQELNKFRGIFGGLKDQLLGNIGKVIHETVDINKQHKN